MYCIENLNTYNFFFATISINLNAFIEKFLYGKIQFNYKNSLFFSISKFIYYKVKMTTTDSENNNNGELPLPKKLNQRKKQKEDRALNAKELQNC